MTQMHNHARPFIDSFKVVSIGQKSVSARYTIVIASHSIMLVFPRNMKHYTSLRFGNGNNSVNISDQKYWFWRDGVIECRSSSGMSAPCDPASYVDPLPKPLDGFAGHQVLASGTKSIRIRSNNRQVYVHHKFLLHVYRLAVAIPRTSMLLTISGCTHESQWSDERYLPKHHWIYNPSVRSVEIGRRPTWYRLPSVPTTPVPHSPFLNQHALVRIQNLQTLFWTLNRFHFIASIQTIFFYSFQSFRHQDV